MVPHEWGDALTLRYDYSNDGNRFTGSLPTELGLLTNLHYFWVPNGGLEGTIPTEIGLLTKLYGMSLANNRQMGGSVPAEVSALQNESLALLDVSGTGIVGNA